MGYSCIRMASVSGEAEPRLTGVALFGLNANFNAGHAGPVWGFWQLVPTDSCDLQALEDPEVYWQGTWRGQRTRICGDGQCQWVGDLKYVGRGHGGSLEGLHYKGEEIVVTFSALPLPYELLGICPPPGPCPAEGSMTGTLWER